MFSDLAGIHAGACANRAWYFGDPLIAIGINLLVNKNETFATGDVNAFPRWVIPHVVRIGRSRKADDHFARVAVQYQQARGPPSRNKQTVVLLVERHGEIGSSLFQLPLHDFAGVTVNDGNLADGGKVYKDPGSLFLQLERFRMSAQLKITVEFLVRCRVKHSNRAVTIADINAFRRRVIAKLIRIVRELYGIDYLICFAIEDLARAIALARNNNSVELR